LGWTTWFQCWERRQQHGRVCRIQRLFS
jgi:hypothetical protein